MKKWHLNLTASVVLAVAGAAVLGGCGDDASSPVDEPDGGDGGSAGSGGSKGGTGGQDSSGGGKGGGGGASGNGGSSGSGGAVEDGGPDAVPGEEAGTEASVEPEAGDDAASGSRTISKFYDTVTTEANDLRGLTYARDGKIYASGHTDVDAENRQLVIVRFNTDGTLDDDFGTDGVVVHDVVAGDEQSMGIVELGNGDLIVQANVSDGNGGDPVTDVGGGDPGERESGQNVVLLKFDSKGDPVTDFGTNGVVVVDFGWTEADSAEWPVPIYDSRNEDPWSGPGFPEDTSWGIALDDSGLDEKIVVFGFGPAAKGEDAETQRFDNDRYIVRVMASDGTVDPDFNGGERFTLNTLGTFSDNGRRGIVEPDGAIVSAGYTNFGAGLGNYVVLIRLLPNGTPDATFGFGIALPGATRFNPYVGDGGFAECYGIAKESSGRYVTTGYGRATGDGIASSYGYATSTAQDLVSFGVVPGGLDTSYGIDGNVAIQSEEANLGDTQDRGRDLVVLPDDRAVHAGRFGPNPALFVTTLDGELDDSVGDGGIFTYTPFENTSHFYAIALSPDGTRIAATTNNHSEGVILAILEIEE